MMKLRTGPIQSNGAMDHSIDYFAYDFEFFVGLEKQEGMEVSWITMKPFVRQRLRRTK